MSRTTHPIKIEPGYGFARVTRGPARGDVSRKLEAIAEEKGTTLSYLRNLYYAKGKINPGLFTEIIARLHASGAITGVQLETFRKDCENYWKERGRL